MTRRTPTLLAVLFVTATACGYSPAEDAYLVEYRQQSPLVEIDEQAALDSGNEICATLRDFKREDQLAAAGLMLQRGTPYGDLRLASKHLCPDVRVTSF